MSIIWIGCDFHPSFQRIAMLDTESGEYVRRKLDHASGEARRFDEGLKGRRVVIGMEACGNSGWFERMVAELGHELWLLTGTVVVRDRMTTSQTDQIKSEREWVEVKFHPKLTVLRLHSYDGMNRLSRGMLRQLLETMEIVPSDRPVVFTGNQKFFSAGADLNEIAALNGPQAYEFAKMGQSLMNAIDQFPTPVYAAIEGYCMGGGLDLVLGCDCRIAAQNSVFGHRGAALGLITGWGGTQRLPRLIGKGRALQVFCAAEKLDAGSALQIGLVDAIAEDPVQEISQRLHV